MTIIINFHHKAIVPESVETLKLLIAFLVDVIVVLKSKFASLEITSDSREDNRW